MGRSFQRTNIFPKLTVLENVQAAFLIHRGQGPNFWSRSEQLYRAECEAARRHGFAGKSCIHPSQIAIANEAFMPKAAEIERARRTLAAAAEAQAKGVGAFLLDGQMVDEPFLISARAVVALANLHAAKNATAEV